MPPRSTVTLLSAGSLLERSWNQFLRFGAGVSRASIAGRAPGVGVAVAVGVGVAVGPVTTTVPRMLKFRPERNSYVPASLKRQLPAQPGPCMYHGSGGAGVHVS